MQSMIPLSMAVPPPPQVPGDAPGGPPPGLPPEPDLPPEEPPVPLHDDPVDMPPPQQAAPGAPHRAPLV